MANSFDINQFNSLVQQASDTLTCDSTCQNNRQSEQLKQAFLDSQENVASAPYKAAVAEKNYVTAVSGEGVYDELKQKEFEKQAQELSSKFIQQFEKDAVTLISQLETYDALLLNYKNVYDLFFKYKEENTELFKELKDETNDTLTNDRKTFYQDQQIDGLKFYYFYFLLIIYIICVICFGIFSLIYPSPTSFKIKIIIFIGLIVLPFFSSWILGIIIYLLYKIYNLLPKNVYKGVFTPLKI
jgi:hypothetical protein